MQMPIKANLPRLDRVNVAWRDHEFSLPFFYRKGRGGPSVFFVHGLGGAKENFYAAFQSPALAECALLAFDLPGTGLAEFYPDAGLDVTGLAEIAHNVADTLLPEPYFLVGASMGGLITLLQFRHQGLGRIQGLINIEGNLCPEDCMFSRRTASKTFDTFGPTFEEMATELRASQYAGDQIIAQSMALNVDVRAYHAYSFQTVAETDSGQLIEEFLRLPLPRLFLYGEANRNLSYLPRLRESTVEVQEIPLSAHFLFYDNPLATFQAVGDFVQKHSANEREEHSELQVKSDE